MPLAREPSITQKPVSQKVIGEVIRGLALAVQRAPAASTRLRLHSRTRALINLSGKHVLITGASSGIGACAPEKFVRHGATVVAVARRKELLDAVVDRIIANGFRYRVLTRPPSGG